MDRICLVSLPKKFGKEKLNQNARDLLSLRISFMGKSESHYMISLENLTSALREKYPDLFQGYDKAHAEMMEKIRSQGNTQASSERIPSPVDRYFESGSAPFCISIPAEVCERCE